MCHEQFIVHPCRNVNFVQGRNGSGKSALVAALQVCLGAAARTTGRGTNLGALVMQGQQQQQQEDGEREREASDRAIVRVTLMNRGEDAYKPQVFGTKIMIEKELRLQGAATLRLRNWKKAVVFERGAAATELRSIVSHFNIAVDNPINILTQEEAKRFIQGKEKQKYQFFLNASGLHANQQVMDEIRASIATAHADLAKQKERIKIKKATLKRAQAEMTRHEDFNNMQMAVRKIAGQIAWKDVEDREAELQGVDDKIDELRERIRGMKDKRKDLEQKITDTDRLDELAEQEEELAEVAANNARQRSEKEANIRAEKERIRIQENQIGEMEARANVLNADLHAQEDRKRHLEAEALRVAEADQRAFRERVQALEAKIDETERSQTEMTDRLANLDEELHQANEAAKEAAGLTKACQKNVQTVQQQLADLQRAQGAGAGARGPLASVFGARITDIMRRIEQNRRANRWEGPVLGPVGYLLRMRPEHERWCAACERVTARSLNQFIVTCDADRTLLLRLFRDAKAGHQYSVITQPQVPRYDVRSLAELGEAAGYRMAHEQPLVSALDALQLDGEENDLLFNVLVDQFRLESTLLCQSEQDMERTVLMEDAHRGERFLVSQIRQVATANGGLVTIRDGNRASQAPPRNPRRFMQVDIGMALQDAQRAVAEAQAEYERSRAEKQDADAAVAQARRAREQCKREKDNLVKRGRTVRQQHTSASNELEDLVNAEDNTAEIEEVTHTISDIRDRLQILDTERANKQASILAMRKQVKTAELSLQELDAQVRHDEEQLAKLTDTMAELRNSRRKHREQLDKLASTEDKLRHNATEIERTRSTFVDAIENTRAAVIARCHEVIEDYDGEPLLAPRKNRQQLVAMETAKKRTIADMARDNDLTEDSAIRANREYQAARVDLRSSKEAYDACRDNTLDMEDDLAERTKKWTKTVKNLGNTVKRSFDRYMNARGYSGEVVFDHKVQTLKIYAQTDNDNDDCQIQDVRQLSGGERSFTTLSLLLALGEIVECPFRVLDEYDVFMDQISRRVAIQQVIGYALDERQAGRQFIFLTPQDLSTVKTNDQVKVFRVGAQTQGTARQRGIGDFMH